MITNVAIEHNAPVEQYYGKWPFWRFAGMQEPASVLFSILNLVAHYRGMRKIQVRVPDTHPMKKYYLGFALASMNAWIWSSVFHTRGPLLFDFQTTHAEHALLLWYADLPITEKLDYFSAALAILYGLYYTAIRLFHLYPTDRHRLTTSAVSVPYSRRYVLWTCLCTFAFLAHIAYLSLLPRFDYTYNMIFNLAVGLTHNLLWVAYSLPAPLNIIRRFPALPRSYRPRCASMPAMFALLTTAATALELFDFPPWGRIIDAHSLWHLATVPIAVYWYDFLVEDSLDEGWRLKA